jgi:hypothetical protein
MAVPPATQIPSITPAEMQILVSRAGLVLNPGQVADLVMAWRQIAGLIALMPRGRPLNDDMALTFRLPFPPDTITPESVSVSVKPRSAPAQKSSGRGHVSQPKKQAKESKPKPSSSKSAPRRPANGRVARKR